MLVVAFYRPPDKTDEDYLNKVKEEISTIKEKHCRDIFVIGGDFNLPDINWEEQTIYFASHWFWLEWFAGNVQ
jgi:hypothetical protein